MNGSIRLSTIISATPKKIYDAWLDSKIHSKFTGGQAQITDKVNAKFSAWDGYITGKNLKLVDGKKIVQAWRTDEFDENDKDSKLEIVLEELGSKNEKTKLTLIHTNIPQGQASQYKKGWIDFYFEPMKKYFGKLGKKELKKEKTVKKRTKTRK